MVHGEEGEEVHGEVYYASIGQMTEAGVSLTACG